MLSPNDSDNKEKEREWVRMREREKGSEWERASDRRHGGKENIHSHLWKFIQSRLQRKLTF